MHGIPLVRASLVSPFIVFLNQIGSPTERLLHQAKLSSAIFEFPEALVPLYSGIHFLDRAARLEGIQSLGVLVGQQTRIQDLGALGQLICHSLTLFDLLITLEQTLGMINSGAYFNLRWEKDWVWLQHHCSGPGCLENLHSQHYSLMMFIKALRMACGATWQPPEIYLQGAHCQEILTMEYFAGVPIHFSHFCTAIKIPRSALSLPLNTLVDETRGELSSDRMPHSVPPKDSAHLSAERIHNDLIFKPDYSTLQRSAPAQDFVGSLRQLVRSCLPHGCPDITLVADAAGISVRSVQRHLAAVGLSYSQVVEQVRFERAMTLLRQPKITLVDIAAELGYTDSNNFSRAFKRWTGISPGQFRTNQNQGLC